MSKTSSVPVFEPLRKEHSANKITPKPVKDKKENKRKLKSYPWLI